MNVNVNSDENRHRGRNRDRVRSRERPHPPLSCEERDSHPQSRIQNAKVMSITDSLFGLCLLTFLAPQCGAAVLSQSSPLPLISLNTLVIPVTPPRSREFYFTNKEKAFFSGETGKET